VFRRHSTLRLTTLRRPFSAENGTRLSFDSPIPAKNSWHSFLCPTSVSNQVE
jgi:hypothetical protein